MMMKSTRAFAIFVLLISALGLLAQDKTSPEAYSAVAVGPGGSVAALSMPFDIRITRYTTEEEVRRFAQLVKDEGPGALRNALEKENVGRINVVGSTGNQIAVARKRQEGPNTIITIVTARTMAFQELARNARSRDYQFGFLRVKLDTKGQGTGQIMAAAMIRFDKKKGQYEIESYGNQYIQVANVRPWK
jgi:hypothetical protein